MLSIAPFVEPHIQAPIHAVQKGKATSAKRLPFFFLHGNWSGEVPLYCFTLARFLGSSQPFYALDTYKYNSPDTPLTLEEMAAAHIQSIRSVQPEGPYMLGGFCSGAYIAYEIARQLQEQGQKVELLVLVSPAEVTDTYEHIRRFLAIIGSLFHMDQIAQLNLFMRMRHFARSIYRKLLPGGSRIKDFSKLLAIDPRLDKTFPPIEALYKDFVGLFVWLAAGFTPKHTLENVAFIWADKNLSCRSRWDLVENGQSSAVLPGYYLTFLNENIQAFAEQLKVYIDNAQTGATQGSHFTSAPIPDPYQIPYVPVVNYPISLSGWPVAPV